MKNLLQISLLCAVMVFSSCSCKGQNHIANSGGTDTTTTNIRNLIVVDSIPVASLTPAIQEILQRRYSGDPSIISFRVIPNPFPRFDSLTLVREFRCNMSQSRIFMAERTGIKIDYAANRPDLQWNGKLVNTGVVSDRVDFNTMYLRAKPDSTVAGGYQFFVGRLRVSNTEAYEFDLLIDEKYDRFVLIHYNPSKLPLAACNGVSAPSTP
ncbi:MAG: hypothetical protein MUF71_10725 [Candidatus Kapabacteria bacterium]|jgi:hypothetical protein|nr:hypothetical protein [Candidatus Kapabacteria bacterium]